MKIFFAAICFFLLSNSSASAQTGFFLVMDSKAPCTNSVISLDVKQQYCLTKEPIIKDTEFKAIGKLQYDLSEKNQFFNIKFTQSGFETIKLICENMPDKQIVLVVKNRAVGVYDGKTLTPTEFMPIRGKANSWEITWVYDNLINRK